MCDGPKRTQLRFGGQPLRCYRTAFRTGWWTAAWLGCVALCARCVALSAMHGGFTLLDGLYDPVQGALIDGFRLELCAAAYGARAGASSSRYRDGDFHDGLRDEVNRDRRSSGNAAATERPARWPAG